MTLIGWVFWGTIATFLVLGFLLQKVFGTKASNRTNHEQMEEEVKSFTSQYVHND
jgi:cytochrome c-type biogenesis protein CcmH/NrfF